MRVVKGCEVSARLFGEVLAARRTAAAVRSRGRSGLFPCRLRRPPAPESSSPVSLKSFPFLLRFRRVLPWVGCVSLADRGQRPI